MRSHHPLDMWEALLDYFYTTDRKPRIQLVHCVFDNILVAIGLSPFAMGCFFGYTFFAITTIVAFPLFIAAVGMMLASDAIALVLVNVYRITTC